MAYTDRDTVKDRANIAGSGHDDAIDDAIAAAETAIELYTGRVWEATSSTARFFNPGRAWRDRIDIDPAQTVTAVAVLDGAFADGFNDLDADDWAPTGIGVDPTGSAAPADGWISGLLRVGGYWPHLAHVATVSVTGTWGAAVAAPDDIAMAATILATRYFQRRSVPLGVSGGGLEIGPVHLAKLDPDVRALLGPRRRQVIG